MLGNKNIFVFLVILIGLGFYFYFNQEENPKNNTLVKPAYGVCAYFKNSGPINSQSPTINPTTIISLGPTTSVQVSCLAEAGPVIILSDNQVNRYDRRGSPLAPNTKVNATLATWISQWPVQDSFNYPVLLAGGPNICFSGGTIQGNYPDQIGADANSTWQYMHDTTAIKITGRDTKVQEVRVDNYGDGIDFDYDTDGFMVRRVHLSKIRDDCFQNDWLYGGIIEDSLLDGCYSAFSARTYSGQSPAPVNGSNNVWTVRNSLVRLEATSGVYQNRGIIPGHDGFFKWDSSGISPKLALHNNVFRADQDANNVGLGIPSGKLASCSNNIMVWLGTGSYPDPLPQTFNGSSCFTITTDRTVWDSAVADWLARNAGI